MGELTKRFRTTTPRLDADGKQLFRVEHALSARKSPHLGDVRRMRLTLLC